MRIHDFHPNRFVAPPEMVRDIQRRFVDYFPPHATVADLGCGEGIFLDLLHESGRTGIGIDLTKQFVENIRKRGLKAEQREVFSFLRRNKSKFQGVFASHLIEHFPAERTLELIELMTNALKPGGILILITPTYDDMLVSSERFWLDVTHVRPYPLILLREIFNHLEMQIVDAGYEPSTKIHGSLRKPHVYIRNFVNKIRFGRYYNVGDTFIVGKKL